MASFAARYAYYLARGTARKWGPWAARKYGGRIAGGAAAAAAGAATGYYRKRKRTGGNPITGRPIKQKKGDIGGRPANDDTRINLNSTFNSVSLYSKRRRRSRYISKQPKSFAGKVKKVVDKKSPTSYYNIMYNANVAYTSGPQVSYTYQEMLGDTYSPAIMLAVGQLNDTTVLSKEITGLYVKIRNYGHIEASTIISDAARNVDFAKFWFSVKHNFDIQCFNNEFTEANPLYVDIYECTAQKDIVDLNYRTPGLAWQRALVDQNAAFDGLSISTAENKGSTPRQAPLFKKYWSVDKVTRIRITSAAPFHYDMYTSGIYNPNRAQDCYAMKGITKGIMFIMGPIQVTTLPINWNFQVTASNKQFKFKVLPTSGHQPMLDQNTSQLAIAP